MEIKEIKNEQVENKGASKFARAKKWVQKTVASVMVAGMTMSTSVMNVSAGNKGTAPTDAGGSSATDMLNYAWWTVIAILGIFAGLGVVKMVQGASDEDTRGRNNGIVTLIASGVGIVIVGIIKTATT